MEGKVVADQDIEPRIQVFGKVWWERILLKHKHKKCHISDMRTYKVVTKIHGNHIKTQSPLAFVDNLVGTLLERVNESPYK